MIKSNMKKEYKECHTLSSNIESCVIYPLNQKMEYLEEVAKLEYEEWATNPQEHYEDRLKRKQEKLKHLLDTDQICKLILLCGRELVGFISIFPHDCDEFPELTPWYSTMYVKTKYRHKGYSKILNDAILKEAKRRKLKHLYLKTTLENYYEKFGAIYICTIHDNEKLYRFDVQE